MLTLESETNHNSEDKDQKDKNKEWQRQINGLDDNKKLVYMR